MGQAAGAVFQVEAGGTECAQVGHDLLGHSLGGPDIEGALRPGLVGEGLLGGIAKPRSTATSLINSRQ